MAEPKICRRPQASTQVSPARATSRDGDHHKEKIYDEIFPTSNKASECDTRLPLMPD